MADVLLARTDGLEGFERHVVIKRIRPELARDRRFIRMFLDEARVAATLHHQNIVQVHDVGEVAGEYFIAMEYVHGEDTRRLLASAARQRSHVPLGYAVAIVSAAAAGLHHAHERLGSDRQPLNIVHRDVSPSNILIGYDGSVKLVDFGIATASMRPETRSGSLKGKLSYMSPEQCSGAPVDRRTDVYALGVCLYELSTTTRMIKGETDYVVMEQIVHGKITPPQTRRPELPTELTAIIMRALATDRDERYATADEFRVALDQFAWNAGLTAPASSISAYMRQQFGHRPEPWLELTADGAAEFEPAPQTGTPANRRPHTQSQFSNSWIDQPRSNPDRPQTGSIPPRAGASDAVTGEADPAASQRVADPPLTTRPTVGWDKQVPNPPVAGIRGRTVAILTGAAVAVVGVAVFAVLGRGGSPAVATAPVAPPAPVVAQPAPAVAQPVLPPAPTVATVTIDAGTPDDAAVARNDPSPGRRRPAPAPASARTVEPERGRPERATRVAAASPVETAPARGKPERAGQTASPAVVETLPPAPAPAMPPVAATPQPAPAPTPTPAPAPAQPAIAVTNPTATAATAPQIIAPAALEANRIAGNKNIVPDALTQDAINRAGTDKLISTYKICVTAEGAISLVTTMKGTGFDGYDEKIRATIRSDWRYKPYLVNGKPTPVCTALRFVYAQR